MKVCLLNDSFPPVIDGVVNVVLNYAKIMQETGKADIMVGTPKYPGTDYSVYPYKVVAYDSFDTSKIVKGYRAGNPLDISEIRDMADFRPDIIHTHCPVVSTSVARMLRTKVGAPVIFTYHTKFDEDIARAVKGEFLRKESIRFLVNNVEACDEVWVVSQGAGENLKSLGFQGEYRVMNNGVDFAKGRVDAETVKEVTKAYDLPDGVPVFLFVGRIISYKGIPVILDALAKLHAQGNDFRMVFIGSGPDEEKLKEKATSLGLMNGNCIFTGAIYDRDVLRAWNTRADLFLFPSTYDTNGIVVREAAACGLASVLIKDSCAAEGITHNRNGFLVEQTAESMYEFLSEASKNLAHIHDVGQNAMDEIYISWEESVALAQKRYAEILELKAAGKYPVKVSPILENVVNIPDEIEREIMSVVNASNRRFDSMMDNAEEIIQNIEKDFLLKCEELSMRKNEFTEKMHEFKDKIF